MTNSDSLLAAIRDNPEDTTARLAYADCLRKSGDELTAAVVASQVDHGLPFAVEAVRETTLEKLADNHNRWQPGGRYDWEEVFGQGTGGNCTPHADACPPGADVDTTPPRLEDVTEVLAAANGENDGAEWVGLFRLRDGRYVVASGSCDYTGWD